MQLSALELVFAIRIEVSTAIPSWYFLKNLALVGNMKKLSSRLLSHFAVFRPRPLIILS